MSFQGDEPRDATTTQWIKNGPEDAKLARHLAEVAMTRRGLAKFIGGAAAVAGVMPGIASAAGTVTPEPESRSSAIQDGRGGTLVSILVSDADSLDPTTTVTGLDVFRCIIEPLAELTPDNQIEGVLAESWEISDDGLEYTFHLRQGITYHDGTPFDANAVKVTFDRVLDPNVVVPFRSWVGPLQETITVDDYTVKMVLGEPFSPLLGNIAIGWYAIASPTSIQAGGDEAARHPVGTGAWKFKEWIPTESFSITANPDYKNPRSWVENKGAPYLDEVNFRIIVEPSTATLAFESGEAEELRVFPARDVKRYQEDSAYEVFIANGGTNVLYIEFAMIQQPEGQFGATFKAPFDDIRVRQAVGYGLNPDEMLQNVLEGIGIRNYGPMPAGVWAYKPEIEEFGFHFDQAKANALLDEAGWVDTDGDGIREKNGEKLEVSFWTWTSSDNDKCAQIIQNQLAQIGFSMTIQSLESATMLAGLDANEHDFNFMSFSLPEPDVIRLITQYSWGLGRYKDETFQTLVSDALKTTDQAERTAIYFEASKKMLADAAMIPLWTPLPYTAVRSNVKNYHTTQTYFLGVYEDITIEE